MSNAQLSPYGSSDLAPANSNGRESLIDVLDRVLDKGVVIAGDIRINLLDIELLTIKIRLLIASADKAREMGIDWWAHDPQLNGKAKQDQQRLENDRDRAALEDRVTRMESKLDKLLERLPAPAPGHTPAQARTAGGRGG